MLKLEIAGVSVTYKNAAELKAKVQVALVGARRQRLTLEEQCKEECRVLRQREKSLERFLGGSARPEPNAAEGGNDEQR